MFDETKLPDLNNDEQFAAHFQNNSLNSGSFDKSNNSKKSRSLCELSCNVLSLSFLEDEKDMYSLDDLKEKY